MYKFGKARTSQIRSVEKMEGESIEKKIERIMTNKEAIKDGAPIIYTPREEGVKAAFNIRTDRFEIAAEAMDLIHKQKAAKSEGKAEMRVNNDKEVGEAESTRGTNEGSNEGGK